jgi:hypothetical protein
MLYGDAVAHTDQQVAASHLDVPTPLHMQKGLSRSVTLRYRRRSPERKPAVKGGSREVPNNDHLDKRSFWENEGTIELPHEAFQEAATGAVQGVRSIRNYYVVATQIVCMFQKCETVKRLMF